MVIVRGRVLRAAVQWAVVSRHWIPVAVEVVGQDIEEFQVTVDDSIVSISGGRRPSAGRASRRTGSTVNHSEETNSRDDLLHLVSLVNDGAKAGHVSCELEPGLPGVLGLAVEGFRQLLKDR